MIQSPKATPSIVTPFASSSIVSSKYKWLAKDRWSDHHFEFTKSIVRFKSLNLLKPPPSAFFMKGATISSAQWVLESSENPETSSGWAEAHGYKHNFSTVFLMFYLSPKTSRFDQLSLLVSSLFISGRCDQIRMIGLEPSQIDQQLREVAEAKKILSFDRRYLEQSSKVPAHRYFDTFTITAEQWWETEQSADDKIELNHLVQKEELKQRQALKKQKAQVKRRRPFLSRLFGKR